MSISSQNKLSFGLNVESLALAWLKRSSAPFKVLARNYRWRGGEVDLIVQEGTELVFIEVRARGPGSWVSALESVSRTKQRRIARTIEHYLARRQINARSLRFDVIACDRGKFQRFKNVYLRPG